MLLLLLLCVFYRVCSCMSHGGAFTIRDYCCLLSSFRPPNAPSALFPTAWRDVTSQGYLLKRRETGNWQRRWCVLTERDMEYYHSRQVRCGAARPFDLYSGVSFVFVQCLSRPPRFVPTLVSPTRRTLSAAQPIIRVNSQAAASSRPLPLPNLMTGDSRPLAASRWPWAIHRKAHCEEKSHAPTTLAKLPKVYAS